MNRWLLVPALAAGLVPGVLAERTLSPNEQNVRVRQVRDNFQLVESLVHVGLRLADANSPLARADECRGLAECLGNEMRRSAGWGDQGRYAQLGEHIQEVLVRGVAANLGQARKVCQRGSADYERLERIHRQLTEFLSPLEQDLTRNALTNESTGLQELLAAVRESRVKLEQEMR